MKETREFYIRLFYIFSGIALFLTISGLARGWMHYSWMAAALFFILAVVPVVGMPFHSLWKFYRRHTIREMRHFQGVGALLVLIGYYNRLHSIPDFASTLCPGLSLIRSGKVLLLFGIFPPPARIFHRVVVQTIGMIYRGTITLFLILLLLLIVLPVSGVMRILDKKFLA